MAYHEIPYPTDLGPDPEPCGERFEVLLAQSWPVARAHAPDLKPDLKPDLDHEGAEVALVAA